MSKVQLLKTFVSLINCNQKNVQREGERKRLNISWVFLRPTIYNWTSLLCAWDSSEVDNATLQNEIRQLEFIHSFIFIQRSLIHSIFLYQICPEKLYYVPGTILGLGNKGKQGRKETCFHKMYILVGRDRKKTSD